PFRPLLLSGFLILGSLLAGGCDTDSTRAFESMSASRSTWALTLEPDSSSELAQGLEDCSVEVVTGPRCIRVDRGRTKGAAMDCYLLAREMTLTCGGKSEVSYLAPEGETKNLEPLPGDAFKVFSNERGVQWSMHTTDKTFTVSTKRAKQVLNAHFELGERLNHQSKACSMGVTLPASADAYQAP